MPEINASFRFSWEPATWVQSFKTLLWTPSPGSTWFQDLRAFDMVSFAKVRNEESPRRPEDDTNQPFESSCNIVHKSFAYLARYSNPLLEKALEQKFKEISKAEELNNAFHSILLLSLRTSRPNMLEVCQRILSSQELAKIFNVSDVIAKAKEEAEYVAKPEHFFISLIKSTSDIVQFPLQRVRKIFSYIYSMTTRAYVPDDINRPPDTSQRAQGTWTFYRDAIYDCFFVVQITKRLLTIRWKTALIGMVVLVPFGVVTYKFSEVTSSSSFKAFLPEHLHGSRDVGECYSPPSPIRREPSAGLGPHLHALEQQLFSFVQERDAILQKCNIERQKNPEWMNSEIGKKLIVDIARINLRIDEQKKKLEQAQKLCKRLDILSHLYLKGYRKENQFLHLLNEKGQSLDKKSLENSKKVFLYLKYLALPEMMKEFNAVKDKFQIMLMPPEPQPSKRARSTSALEAPLQCSHSSPAALSSPATQAIKPLTLPLPAIVVADPTTHTLAKRQSSAALPRSS